MLLSVCKVRLSVFLSSGTPRGDQFGPWALGKGPGVSGKGMAPMASGTPSQELMGASRRALRWGSHEMLPGGGFAGPEWTRRQPGVG